MTKDVLVSIKGLQIIASENEDEVEVVTSGNYLQKNGKHYIRYEEVVEGMDGTIQNLIKLDGDSMEVTRKGLTNTHMIFEKNKKNETYYNTPFGSLLVGISATNIDVKDCLEQINVTVQYALDINYEHMADCTINMNIRSKENGEFHLS
ncbi:MAG: DUF1934 domain-containing protein [Marvinbryantia sp.]|jgi:uncharacterized beta-barrel protein YwiB (DUF1934 family)